MIKGYFKLKLEYILKNNKIINIKSNYRIFSRYKYSFILLIPGVLFFIIFHYIPMYGVLIAFKDYSPFLGFFKSAWVGFKHFESFFLNPYFGRMLRNTLSINIIGLLIAFPVPIILSLLLNEIRVQKFKKTVQMVTYMPNFISDVIIVGLIYTFLSPGSGIINKLLTDVLGINAIPFMIEPKWFYTIYVGSGIWKETGFNSIIFLAAISSVNIALYEAVDIDGGGRMGKFRYVTFPCIVPTIMFMLIFRMAAMFNVDAAKILIMYNPLTYETADVFSTYVYRVGLQGANFGMGTAVSFMNALVSLLLLVLANWSSKKLSETSLW